MRFYPFGSSSLNQIYNTQIITSASNTSYSVTASFGIQVATASYALAGIAGINGLPGSCSYLPGPQGDTGSQGFGGPVGGVSVPYPRGVGY